MEVMTLLYSASAGNFYFWKKREGGMEGAREGRKGE